VTRAAVKWLVDSPRRAYHVFVAPASMLSTDARLDAIVQAIVAGVQPTRIILFGSRARGDAHPGSDYDLVVELPFERANYHETYTRVAQTLREARSDVSVDVLIRAPGEIERRRDDPGYLDWAIAGDGIILYPDDPDREGLRPRLRGAVRENEPFPSIAEWLRYAQQDDLAIDALLERTGMIPWAVVAFHAQQLAEKHLKTLFITQHFSPPRTHEFSVLIRQLGGRGHDLSARLDDAVLLERYAIGIRYPGDVEIPDEATAREAVAAARRIVAAVQRSR